MRISDDRGYLFRFKAGRGPNRRSKLAIIVRPGISDGHVAALDVAPFAQAFGMPQPGRRPPQACWVGHHQHHRCCVRAAHGDAAASPSSGMKSPPSDVDCHATPSRPEVVCMQYKRRYHALTRERTMFLRCGSLEPTMSLLGRCCRKISFYGRFGFKFAAAVGRSLMH
jgi:hypothetical protein